MAGVTPTPTPAGRNSDTNTTPSGTPSPTDSDLPGNPYANVRLLSPPQHPTNRTGSPRRHKPSTSRRACECRPVIELASAALSSREADLRMCSSAPLDLLCSLWYRTDSLADPVLELHGPSGFVTITNNNWRDTQEDPIQATGIPPTNDLESAILVTLNSGILYGDRERQRWHLGIGHG